MLTAYENCCDVAVLHRNLRFAVGFEPRERAASAERFKSARQSMRKHDAARQKLGRFVSRVPVHNPLVACAARVHALRYILRLFHDARDDFEFVRVADVAVDAPADFRKINCGSSRNFAANHEESVPAKGFDRNAAHGIRGKARVQNRVRNLVAHLVRVAGGYAFDGVEFWQLNHMNKTKRSLRERSVRNGIIFPRD